MRLIHVLGAAALLLLSGCAGFTTQEALQGQGNANSWKTHKERVAALDGWQIDGKVGIRAPRDSGSGTLFWLQRQGYYDIRLTLDSDSRLARLEQDGWDVEYSSYAQQDGYWLPERLKLHGENLDVTLVIKSWQPRLLGQAR